MFEIVEKPIDALMLAQEIASESDGAIVTFSGIVRGKSDGKKVVFLEYEAYTEMAIKMMKQIGDEVKQTWNLESVKIQHRIGRLNVGETSVAIVVSSPHRADGFAACQHVITRLKEIVPIWKKEVFEDGEVWIDGPTSQVATS